MKTLSLILILSALVLASLLYGHAYKMAKLDVKPTESYQIKFRGARRSTHTRNPQASPVPPKESLPPIVDKGKL
jgi:hypothetical protein